ncbi:MAG: amidophosphoribosyltransferase, partial [Oscillospiraceae bacterium]|nr:amidophosphoribosyltransferase [Oscillospiraceae bacterium]
MALHEECGVFGVFSNTDDLDVAAAAYHGLFALQHRGQESCGIYVNDRGVQTGHKAKGLVNEVFTESALKGLGQGRMAIGHVRYGSAQSNRARNAQPMHVNHGNGSLVLAHNGCITNAGDLRRKFEFEGCIFHTTSEAEVIAYTITRERLMVDSIEEAVQEAYNHLEGAFSMVMMSAQKLIACRDKHGFRPLCIGKLGKSFIVASETCALDAVGAKFLRDVLPGEIVVIDQGGLRSLKTYVNPAHLKCMCVFEYIYFARPDSVIDGNSVHISRETAGRILAQTYKIKADVVIGVPDSGLQAAIGYAKESGIPYAIGFNKNRYIGRTFIQPAQGQRQNSVSIKLNPVPAVVKGKRVIIVDDSIVRGTTTTPIVQLLRDAGATQVHVMVASPPYKFPCYYGTDVKSREDLIANRYDTFAGIAGVIGADSVGFFPADQLHKLVRPGQGLCTACFDGDYPVQPKGTPLARYDKK